MKISRKSAVKKVIALVLAMVFLVSGNVFASNANPQAFEPTRSEPRPIDITIAPDVQIVIYSQSLLFRNYPGERVYPIMFEGSIYVPVRAISNFFNRNPIWDGETTTITLGLGLPGQQRVREDWVPTNSQQSVVSAMLSPNIAIYIENVSDTFSPVVLRNANADRIYPILFDGTTYLPLRAIAGLFGMDARWDGETRTAYFFYDFNL